MRRPRVAALIRGLDSRQPGAATTPGGPGAAASRGQRRTDDHRRPARPVHLVPQPEPGPPHRGRGRGDAVGASPTGSGSGPGGDRHAHHRVRADDRHGLELDRRRGVAGRAADDPGRRRARPTGWPPGAPASCRRAPWGQGANRQAAVWVSPMPGAPFGQVAFTSAPGSVMDDVSAGTLGLFASGTEDGQVTIWTSGDGQRWVPSPNATKVIGGAADPVVSTILASTNGASANVVYAAGSVRSGAATNAALWASGDGLNWHLVSSAPRRLRRDGRSGDHRAGPARRAGIHRRRRGVENRDPAGRPPRGSHRTGPAGAGPRPRSRSGPGRRRARSGPWSAVSAQSRPFRARPCSSPWAAANTAQTAWTSTDGISLEPDAPPCRRGRGNRLAGNPRRVGRPHHRRRGQRSGSAPPPRAQWGPDGASPRPTRGSSERSARRPNRSVWPGPGAG